MRLDTARQPVDLGDARVKQDIYLPIFEKCLISQDQMVLGGFTEEKVFRERWTFVRQPAFVANDRNVLGVTRLARAEGCVDSSI
jgi:hypothetical protein